MKSAKLQYDLYVLDHINADFSSKSGVRFDGVTKTIPISSPQ